MDGVRDFALFALASGFTKLKQAFLAASPTSGNSFDTSALVSILVTVLTVYFTVLSMYHTARFAVRTLFFVLKWLCLGGAALSVIGVAQGWWTPSDVQRAGAGAYGLGRRGVDWWAGASANAPPWASMDPGALFDDTAAAASGHLWGNDDEPAEQRARRSVEHFVGRLTDAFAELVDPPRSARSSSSRRSPTSGTARRTRRRANEGGGGEAAQDFNLALNAAKHFAQLGFETAKGMAGRVWTSMTEDESGGGQRRR